MPFHPSPLLIATLGSKAQIITLTLDALGQQGDLPGEVVVVHTDRGRPETAEALARLRACWLENKNARKGAVTQDPLWYPKGDAFVKKTNACEGRHMSQRWINLGLCL